MICKNYKLLSSLYINSEVKLILMMEKEKYHSLNSLHQSEDKILQQRYQNKILAIKLESLLALYIFFQSLQSKQNQ
jgi:hypothetical protein